MPARGSASRRYAGPGCGPPSRPDAADLFTTASQGGKSESADMSVTCYPNQIGYIEAEKRHRPETSDERLARSSFPRRFGGSRHARPHAVAGMTRSAKAGQRPGREHFVSTAAIATAFFLVIVAAFALNLNLRRLRESFAWVDHTDRVLLQASVVQGELLDLVGAARAFAATGQPATLDRLDAAGTHLPEEVARLRALSADNTPQLRRVESLGRMIDARIAWAERVVQERRAAGSQPGTLEEDDAARTLAADIGTGLREFRSTELALLAERERRAERDATLATGLATVTMLLALISGGLGVALTIRDRQ